MESTRSPETDEMRNLFEAAVRNQRTRLVNSGKSDRDALTTLLPEDLPDDFQPGMASAHGNVFAGRTA